MNLIIYDKIIDIRDEMGLFYVLAGSYTNSIRTALSIVLKNEPNHL